MKKITILMSMAASLLFATPSFAQDAGAGQSQQSTAANPAAFGSANNEVPGYKEQSSTCCFRYYDHSNANGNARQIVTNFNQKLAAMQLAIIEAMRLSTGQLSGNLREQSGAEHNLADQVDDRKVVQSIEQARYEAQLDATTPPTACFVLTSTKGSSMQSDAIQVASETAKQVNDYMKGEVGPAAEGPQYAAIARVEAHCKYFASDVEVELGICSSNSQMPDADINIGQSLLFEENGTSSGLSEDRLRASNVFIMNAVGQTLPPMDATLAKTVEGRELMGQRSTFLARHSGVEHVLSTIQASKKPTQDSRLKSWAQSTAKELVGYENENFDNFSMRDWVKVLTQGFYLNQKQGTSGQITPAVALKDIRNMMSVQNFMSFETYKQLEQMNVLLALQLAILNEGTRHDLIKR